MTKPSGLVVCAKAGGCIHGWCPHKRAHPKGEGCSMEFSNCSDLECIPVAVGKEG